MKYALFIYERGNNRFVESYSVKELMNKVFEDIRQTYDSNRMQNLTECFKETEDDKIARLQLSMINHNVHNTRVKKTYVLTHREDDGKPVINKFMKIIK